ncbi:MAG TPA: hypothetical protein VMB05_06350 [Solirubrobacteraceae bacterium]|nr:hypothetical protein [Solirubrobacteraceae bacterium]
MKARRNGQLHRRLEAWLWTGPVGHFLGGALDVAQGLATFYRDKRKAGDGPSVG